MEIGASTLPQGINNVFEDRFKRSVGAFALFLQLLHIAFVVKRRISSMCVKVLFMITFCERKVTLK